jgi:hypothetical protein
MDREQKEKAKGEQKGKDEQKGKILVFIFMSPFCLTKTTRRRRACFLFSPLSQNQILELIVVMFTHLSSGF